MKVVIAPDSFKESLSRGGGGGGAGGRRDRGRPAGERGPLPAGGRRAGHGGGDGGGHRRGVPGQRRFRPPGQPRAGAVGVLGKPASPALPGEVGLSAGSRRWSRRARRGAHRPAGAETAVIEMAAASGLVLVPADLRDPMKTTTFGTGQLILRALDAGAQRDHRRHRRVGHRGRRRRLAQALGAVFLDRAGRPCVCGLAGGGLADVADVDISDLDDRLKDVQHPRRLRRDQPADRARRRGAGVRPAEGRHRGDGREAGGGAGEPGGGDPPAAGRGRGAPAGGGAAGGLGAGLVAFAGAKLQPGLPLIAEAVGLRQRLAGADLCITGEGKLDRSSSFGKTAVGVAKIASRLGVPVVCIPGQAAADAPRELFAAVLPLVAGEVTVRQAMREPAAPAQAPRRRGRADVSSK